MTIGGSAPNAGSADGTNNAARFHSPAGLAADANGNLFVADTGNHTIRMGTPLFPLLRVVANPDAPEVQVAQFQVDGGNWQSVGSAVRLLPGAHTIAFLPVLGWITPSNQTISLGPNQTVTGVYVQQLASLQVALGSPAAIAAGASWQLDGGSWQPSDAVESACSFWLARAAFTNIVRLSRPPTRTSLDTVNNALSLPYTPLTTNHPALSIASPAAGQKWTNQTLTMSGVATDSVAVAYVWYQLNGGGWLQAVGAQQWQSVSAALPPGAAIAQAYATDSSGNFSKTNTVRFINAPMAPLTITYSGLGSSSPNLNGHFLVVGQCTR